MIASGKSTLVQKLGKEFSLPVMEEFDADDEVFNTLLDWLYVGKDNVEMLLQIYFLHSHYLKQQKYGNNFVVDRDIIEHWLFAQNNLKHMPEVMNMYNGVFMAYMNSIEKPDIYIILDIDWVNFESRIKKRGRKSEVDNFDKNKDYFKELLSTYKQKLMAQCDIYDIPYFVVNVNGLNEDEVFDMVVRYLTLTFY